MVISGKELAAACKAKMAEQVKTFPEKYGRLPHLVVVLVGEDAGSVSYVTGKTKAAEKRDDAFLFPYSPEPYASPNFNHPVYLGKVLTRPNAAGSPEWTYVVFPKGTYNRWHSHKTGQILIVTDGVGYHQIQGGKI